MSRALPQVIKDVGFDFLWDEERVWALDVPVEEMSSSVLTWHLDFPFLFSCPDGYYDLCPREVLEHSSEHPEEYARTMRSDTTHPIDIMFWRGRWLILDGLHRLMKQTVEGKDMVPVRKIPKSAIPEIRA